VQDRSTGVNSDRSWRFLTGAEQDQEDFFDWNRIGAGSGVIFNHSVFEMCIDYLHSTQFVTGVKQEARVDNFSVIRSHTRSSSQVLKDRSGVGVEKIRLRIPLFPTETGSRSALEWSLDLKQKRSLQFFQNWSVIFLTKNGTEQIRSAIFKLVNSLILGQMSPGQMGPQTNGYRTMGPQTNGSLDKWIPDKRVPESWKLGWVRVRISDILTPNLDTNSSSNPNHNPNSSFNPFSQTEGRKYGKTKIGPIAVTK